MKIGFLFVILGLKSHIPRPYIFNEWSGDGHQRNSIISECAIDRRLIRCVGSKVFPFDHCLFHMRTNPIDDN